MLAATGGCWGLLWVMKPRSSIDVLGGYQGPVGGPSKFLAAAIGLCHSAACMAGFLVIGGLMGAGSRARYQK